MMNNFEYRVAEEKIRETAKAEFDRTVQAGMTERQKNDARRTFVHAAVDAWFVTQPEGCSITVEETIERCEIRDEYYNGSITVYGPRREHDGWNKETNEPTYRIKPASLSGSSWETTNARELAHRLTMMQIAIHFLNKFNEVVLEWKRVPNPMAEVTDLRERVKRYEDAATQRREEEAAKKATRDARKR